METEIDNGLVKYILRNRYLITEGDEFTKHLVQANRMFGTEITLDDLLYHQEQTKKLSGSLLEYLKPHGTYLEHLPSGAFKDSGTMVNTVLLRLER